MFRRHKIIATLSALLGLIASCGGGKDSSSDESSEPLVVEVSPVSGAQPDQNSNVSLPPVTTVTKNPVLPNPTTPTPTPTPTPNPTPNPVNTAVIYYNSGYLALTFSDEIPIKDNYQGWIATVGSSRVLNTNVMTTDYNSTRIERN